MHWLQEYTTKCDGRKYHAQIRIEQINEEKIHLLKQSGCVSVTLAIETFDQKYREKYLNRFMSNDDIVTNCAKLKDNGIKIRTEQMLGLPDTTFDNEIALLKLNCEIGPTLSWSSIYQPYLGTELGEFCRTNGLYNGDNSDVSASFFENTILNYSDERKREINELQKLFATCAHIPEGWKYAKDKIKNNITLKEHLYSILYR